MGNIKTMGIFNYKRDGVLPRVCEAMSIIVLAAIVAACTPTVKVAPPDEPIEINLNVKIEKDVRLRIDKELQEAFQNNPELFGIVEDVKAQEIN